MDQIRINPHILRWARERLELPSEVVAKKAGTKPEKIAAAAFVPVRIPKSSI
ncbi:MAG: hypothetical protein GXO75_17590 [Calditrichaeota bacterium]|nr:hypothetical protein [Calditrichota bacterium]